MEDLIEFLKIMAIALLVLIVMLSVILSPILFAGWHSSCRAAVIFNKQNGTTWTCSDFFWASEQINSGRQQIQLIK